MGERVTEYFREQFGRGWIREGKVGSFDELKGNLLEVGCGPQLTYHSRNAEIHGIDITPEVATLFKKRYPWAHTIVGDVRMLPFKKGSFDVVVSSDLLHHLIGRSPKECQENIEAAVSEMKHILKPAGVFLVNELIVRNSTISTVIFYFTLLCARFGIEIPSLDITSKVTTFFLTEKMLKRISMEKGFKLEEMESRNWALRGREKEKSIITLGQRIYMKFVARAT